MYKSVYNRGRMKIGIYFHREKDAAAAAERLLCILREAGADAKLFRSEEEISGVDRLIVLGGDGTVLRAARRAAGERIPLFGVNFGHLGFLTEFGREEIEEAAAFALGETEVSERSMLEVDFGGRLTRCLNECALLRPVAVDKDDRPAEIEASINGSGAAKFLTDGLIVATPTGSTAHSLSAGGSIMTPGCATFMLTPVCACSMRARPIAYPDSAELSLRLPAGQTLLLYGDGRFLGEVKEGEVIKIRRSRLSARFLTRSRAECLLRIAEKIN